MGRRDHFLNLSKATGRHGDHAVMLAKMDCFEKAVSYAHANLGDPDDVLCLAKALLDKGQRDLALDAANWGLSLPVEENGAWSSARHGRGMLARWLRTEAQTGNRHDLALSAAIAAFEVSLSSEDFEAARHVSGTAHWPQTRARFSSGISWKPAIPMTGLPSCSVKICSTTPWRLSTARIIAFTVRETKR